MNELMPNIWFNRRQFAHELKLYFSLHNVYLTIHLSLFVLPTIVECFNSGLTVLRSASIVLRTFPPLCYKRVTAMRPSRIKDQCSVLFSKFPQIALVAFGIENFENTRA